MPSIKWVNPGKGVAPSLHLGVVDIEKGAFGSPSTTIANFIFTDQVLLCITDHLNGFICLLTNTWLVELLVKQFYFLQFISA